MECDCPGEDYGGPPVTGHYVCTDLLDSVPGWDVGDGVFEVRGVIDHVEYKTGQVRGEVKIDANTTYTRVNRSHCAET